MQSRHRLAATAALFSARSQAVITAGSWSQVSAVEALPTEAFSQSAKELT